MIKKVEKSDWDRPEIHHITTVRKNYDWSDFFDKYSDHIMEIASEKGLSPNGEYMVIPVFKQIFMHNKRQFVKGRFNSPIFRVTL